MINNSTNINKANSHLTFSNISAISWRSFLLVEEAGVPEESQRPWASNW
jgi:hypothetical protein